MDMLHPFQNNAAERFRPVSFLMMNSPVTAAFPSISPHAGTLEFSSREGEHTFDTSQDLLDHVTRNWRSDFVTTDLNTKALLEKFATRPFFMVVSVDAPMYLRYRRSLQ